MRLALISEEEVESSWRGDVEPFFVHVDIVKNVAVPQPLSIDEELHARRPSALVEQGFRRACVCSQLAPLDHAPNMCVRDAHGLRSCS